MMASEALTDALTGGFADAPTEAARAFRAAMNAMAFPGRIQPITGGQGPAPLSPAAATLLLTLCDPETPLYLAGAHDTQAVRDWVTFHTGAPLAGASEAMFAVGNWDALQPVSAFAIGTSEYPDRSATLIVESAALEQAGSTLTGPGIKETAAFSLPEPEVFAANAARFPLGWDAYFTCGDRLAALPRSTKVS